jgi:hypothetical protein
MNEPVRLPVSAFVRGVSRGVDAQGRQMMDPVKIKRGGGVATSNSGGMGHNRARTPVRAMRDQKHHSKHLPWPARGKVIWDPAEIGVKK